MVDQDAPHQTCGEAVEVLAVGEVELALLHQFEEELVDDAGRLQQAAAPLPAEEQRCDGMEVRVDQSEELLGMLLPVLVPLPQERGHIPSFFQSPYPCRPKFALV